MDAETAILISKRRKTSHIFHFIMAVITAGIWVPFWLLVYINNGIDNARIHRKIRINEENVLARAVLERSTEKNFDYRPRKK